MSDHASSLIDTLVGAVMFAVAVSMLIFLSRTYSKDVAYAAKSIDEKQSIELGSSTAIDTESSHRTKLEYTSTQVLNTILSVDENITEVKIDGSIVPKTKITAAKNGDERAISSIKSMMLFHKKFHMEQEFDTNNEIGDHLSAIEFTRAEIIEGEE